MVAGPEPDLWSGPEMRAEFWSFLRYAGPPTVSYALDAGVEIVALTYIAKIGERELAAAGLAFMLSNMTGHAVYTGYTLDGTTYEVTRNGYATQSHSFTC